jgi:SAM-dependent methyltransferase
MRFSPYNRTVGNIFSRFRGAAAAPAPRKPEPPSKERIPRRSSGLAEFSARIAGEEGLHILDLGPTSPTNIALFTGLGHKVYNEDLLLASTDRSFLKKDAEGKEALDVAAFYADNLNFRSTEFDAILAWDIADYLPEPLVKPMVERIAEVMRPRGVLLGFFHTRDAGPDAPHYRYHIVGKDALELQRGSQFRLQRVFNNRHIENLFTGFDSLKFFLARDNVREVLVVR